MAKIDEKMQMIGAAVVLQAEQERRRIIDEANGIREREIAAYKDQVIEKMFDEIQQRTRTVRQNAIREKAQAETGAHRELLTRREALSDMVFEAVRERLRSYSASEAYRQALLDQIAAVRGRFDHTDSTVQLREGDRDLAGRIESLLPGCRVEFVRDIRLGGFRLRNRKAGILLDETLDLKLEEQRPWFLRNCGLAVQGSS